MQMMTILLKVCLASYSKPVWCLPEKNDNHFNFLRNLLRRGTWDPAGVQMGVGGSRGGDSARLDVSKICQGFITLGFS